jgi:hypothetical protein
VGAEEKVRWLDVSVQQAMIMNTSHALASLSHPSNGSPGWYAHTGLDALGEAPVGREVRDDVWLTFCQVGIVDRKDVFATDLSENLSLSPHASPGQSVRHEFEGERLAQVVVEDFIDLPEVPTAEVALDLISSINDHRGRCVGHSEIVGRMVRCLR